MSAGNLHGVFLKSLISGLTEDLEAIESQPAKDDDLESRIVTFDDLFIRTKDKRLVRFAPNVIQLEVLNDLWPNWTENDFSMAGMREMFLKARQFGFSTLFLAILFCDTINTPNTETIIIAHDDEATRGLFQRVKVMFDHLPAHKQLKTKYSNRTELVFEETNSRIFVATAGSKDVGRSKTINNVLASEYAFWANAETTMTGLLEAVPEGGNVIIETTANGLGNEFHIEWERCENGDSSFNGHFYAWFQHPEYRIVGGRLSTPPDEVEQLLIDKFGVDEEQLAWRRKKLRNPGTRKKFPQEYPATAEEAFMASGNPYFDRELLNTMLKHCVPGKTGVEIPSEFINLRAVYGKGIEKDKDDQTASYFEIYEPPIAGRSYIVSADTAEGVTDRGDPDYDSADVIDTVTLEQVAHLHGRWDTHHFGLLLAELGFYYNTALLGIERNHHGHAVINSALNGGKYPPMKPGHPGGLYFHEGIDENKKKLPNPDGLKPGWPTTHHTKVFALDALAADLINSELTLHSKATVRELMRFVKKPGGKFGGEGNSHDDRVISIAIGSALLMVRPRPVKQVEFWIR